MLDAILLVLFFGGFGIIVLAACHRSLAIYAANHTESPPHPIEIYKRQYVEGHLTLEEYEEKVYNVVEPHDD